MRASSLRPHAAQLDRHGCVQPLVLASKANAHAAGAEGEGVKAGGHLQWHLVNGLNVSCSASQHTRG